MLILPYVLSGFFGLIIGSFLNVAILRYNTGKGFGGRSMCFSCNRTLEASDLVPVFSFLFSGGRCRTCKSKISRQYILVEIITAILFMFAWHHNASLFDIQSSVSTFIASAKLIVDMMIMSLLVFMSGYDLNHKIIPDPSVFLFGFLALLSQLIVGTLSWKIFFAGIILAIPFYLIWLLSRGAWMGLGDAKLALGIGWMLGLSAGGTAIIFGYWIGAAIMIGLLLLRLLMKSGGLRRWLRKIRVPRLTFGMEIPFAPFLISGLLIVYLLGYNLFAFII